ncbi:MAG: hypothetical protein P1P65_06225 [Treponema sp.]
MKKILIAFFHILFCISCKGVHSGTVPFAVSVPQCKIGAEPGYYEAAGIEFDFYNTSTKDMQEVEVQCMIFDAETKKNPFIGSNIVRAKIRQNIEGGTQKKLIIPLDNYIYIIPEKPYLIDYFFIRKITFNDGSEWKDVFGIYKV